MEQLATEDVLLVNGRWLILDAIPQITGEEEVAICDDSVVYARLKKETVKRFFSGDFSVFLKNTRNGLKSHNIEVTLISYPWDLVKANGKSIISDFHFSGKQGIEGKMKNSVILGNKDDVFIAPNAEVQPNVVLDTTNGPIIIDEGAKVFPFSRIEGPSYIGKNSQILGGKIREGTSIGFVCRIGGELEETIFHGYSNKYHDGFIGHSYICEWVNLGAMTTNSDLRNDYGEVPCYVGGVKYNTKEIKVGSFIGDHTKTAIGTFLNTGSVIGVMCNIASSGGVVPKFIPSFSWYIKQGFSEAPFEKALETAKISMSRRNVSLDIDDIKLLKYVWERTSGERKNIIEHQQKNFLK